jgi:hypothetical protein
VDRRVALTLERDGDLGARRLRPYPPTLKTTLRRAAKP